MKVLLLSHGFQDEYEVGFANGLAANAIDVTLVASDGTLRNRLDARVEARNLRGSQDPRRSTWAKTVNMVKYIFGYLRIVASREHDAVHSIGMFSTGNAWLSVIEAFMTRCLSRRFVLTVHNVLPHDDHTLVNRWLYRVQYGLPHQLVVHTIRAHDQLIAEFNLPPATVHVMEHGIARFPEYDESKRNAVRQQLGLSTTDSLVLFFGNLSKYKGLDLLIEAFGGSARETSRKLLIAGRCRWPELRQSIADQIADSAAREAIVWWERFVGDEEVPALFFAADVLALPYRHIDQSGVLFMAMATGLPVLATDVGSFKQYVRRHAGLVVEPDNAHALANGLRQFDVPLSADNRLELMRRARAFDWRATVPAVLNCYAPVQR